MISFQASGDVSDYDDAATKANILCVLAQAAGLDEAPSGASLEVLAGSVVMEANLPLAGSAAADAASAAFEAALTSAADLTELMEDAGIDITIESKPSKRISQDIDSGCTGGTGFGEECGVPFGVVLGPVGGVLVLVVGVLAFQNSKRGKHPGVSKPSATVGAESPAAAKHVI